jgi:hypothetical protein
VDTSRNLGARELR